MDLRDECDYIVKKSIEKVLPDNAVRSALKDFVPASGKTVLVAVGKAAWSMANAAYGVLGDRISAGAVITKYGHSMGAIGQLEIFEAGHPVLDDDTVSATERVLAFTENLSKNDKVLFLVSGGGSALFELPKIPLCELADINRQLLSSGADIVEMNTVRKRFSVVKGGRFALHCKPAQIFSVVLSDIIGDPLDMIAGGPAFPDSASKDDAKRIVKKYKIKLTAGANDCLDEETPKSLDNVTALVTGSVKELCRAAAENCRTLGYDAVILDDSICGEAKTEGAALARKALDYVGKNKPTALIVGGETVVRLTGKGKGGRNQEFALAAAEIIDGIENVAVFSVGSDGTDGPTDAAGGFADGTTAEKLRKNGISIPDVLHENDAYNALLKTGGLIITGPTGTNVNDVAVALIK